MRLQVERLFSNDKSICFITTMKFFYRSLELKLNVGIYLFTFSYSRQRYLFLKMGKEVLDLDAVFCI